ncbi:hypothetical protein [Cyclobacterium roseum]|uniref:hypothetical protein n=1 Tax=Cyclobacterium roseum TaxID=2666137 RepID=UPI001391BF03|nr:hypothetical protein [Cyclobacterium roseum]
MIQSLKFYSFGLLLSVFVLPLAAQQTLWEPVADKVFLQEKSEILTTPSAVTQVAILSGRSYAVLDGKLQELKSNGLQPVPGSPAGISKLEVLDHSAWVMASSGFYRFADNSWEKISDDNFVDVCLHLGKVHAATRDAIYVYEQGKLTDIEPKGGYLSSDVTMLMEDGTQLLADPVKLGPITSIASYSGTLHVLRPGQLVQLSGKVVNEHLIDWGNLPSKNTGELLSMGSRLFISTDRGLGVLRGASLQSIQGEDGLPVEETRQLVQGFDRDVWIGTPRGAIRMLNEDWHYFGADHWLPDNRVNDIAVAENEVLVATEGGIGIIRYEPFTLRKKADHYEYWLENWGHKRMGFIHTIRDYQGEWVREISDNDGAHTATYLSAMSYKYAVTGEEAARNEAVDAFQAMLWLERITPIDGLIARSIWSRKGDKGAMGQRGSGGLPAKWNATADSLWYWKGDASSDEIIAHFYSVSLFHDLAAEGKEKELAKEHMRRIAGYIMENNWVLIDSDGQPTRWGRWNPEYLLRPYGWSDRGVNGLEALAFSYSTYALTGEERFKKGYQQLVDWGYAENTIKQKNTFPPSQIAPWDDNLAFEAYNTLLRYEKDPEMRSIYLRSLERTFEIKRMEKIPWFNFTYAAMTGNDADLDAAVQHLREWTLDAIEHNYRNSHRDDLFVEEGYTSYEGGVKAISPREAAVTRGARRAIVLDGGQNSKRIMEPVGFIRDYWMGRHYGLILDPEVNDPELLEVDKRSGEKVGAAPYDGPDRPDFL